jgi:SAM-dependent MidA family methyltransferase
VTLREVICREIRRAGPIPFSRYMELCLYHPELGYYARPQEKFGKGGDFYTSSDVHAVFGRLLARHFEEMWRALGAPARVRIVEFGPGRGLFAQDVLDWAGKKFPAFAAALEYVLVETSPALRARLQERFAGRPRVTVTGADLPGSGSEATIVFANEFFDALPVEVVTPEGQVYVTGEGGRFRELFRPPSPAVDAWLDRYSVRPEAGQRVEVCLAALEYARRMAALVERGFVLLIDYGYTREEQLAGRHRDTLMTYRAHAAGEDPYEAPGEQDITTHVNFTALRAAAAEHGLKPLALLTQAELLMGIGEANEFADAFEDCRLPQERAKVMLQLKHLVTPAGMGEIFQALLFSRGVEKEKATRMGGLKFAR